MGFSSRLSKVALTLFKAPIDHIDVYIHEPSDQTHNQWIVVAEGFNNDWPFMKGSGMSMSLWDSFIKALVELGEIYLVREFGLKDRSGLSGGLMSSTAMFRAKAELMERDAFLYHYRNRIPFNPNPKVINTIDENRKVLIYELNNCSRDFYSCLATDNLCAEGKNPCLLIGLGAHSNRETAMKKAFGEYSTMFLDHLIRPNWCKELELNRSKAQRIPDFHHSYSRDSRNIKRFSELCSNKNLQNNSRPELDKNLWKINFFKSPLRFFKFVQVDHNNLVKLEFGIPEDSDSENELGPLYHPIW